MDCYLPGAMEVPRMEVAHIETPTPLNPLGCKGTGEGGTIPSATAVALAIEDALSDLKVKVDRLPVSPETLLNSIERAKKPGVSEHAMDRNEVFLASWRDDELLSRVVAKRG